MTSGIYAIQHTPSGKVYVGKSKNIEARLRGHFAVLGRGTHHNVHLQRAWTKYGSEEFHHSILEVVPEELERSRKEAMWCRTLRAHDSSFGYNLGEVREDDIVLISEDLREKRSKAGRFPMTSEGREKVRRARTGSKATLETRGKMSEARLGRVISRDVVLRIADSNRGKKRSVEQRQRISEALTGREGRPHTEASKNKISEALMGRKRTLEQRERISKAVRTRVRKPHTSETRARIAETVRASWARRKASSLPLDEVI